MAAPTPENFPKPQSITGGCLWGSIRYKVDFPEHHDFLQWSGSCQCTQCRRQTGTLVFYAHSVPLRCLTYVPSSGSSLTAAEKPKSLKNFVATPEHQRGFCTDCGSLLYWRDEKRDDVELALGSVDPEFLVGGGGGGGDGPSTGYGFALANCSGQNVFCGNEIKGVTDGYAVNQRGARWVKSSEHGARMP
ncbi:Mss4-like protein [Apiospora phragmitis]|uniref:Mss4-like protein n=1 Tax=Apiospora phragmitis TaxID=2905665 RepID=A0ABR1VTN0_9PEZI